MPRICGHDRLVTASSGRRMTIRWLTAMSQLLRFFRREVAS
jgi:hypothetical protein